MADNIPQVLIPVLLCDERLFRDLLSGLEETVTPQMLMSPRPDLADSVADIRSPEPERFVLGGSSYGRCSPSYNVNGCGAACGP